MEDLSEDPRFWALKPSQGRALEILPKLMAKHGREGVLPWTRAEIQSAVHLGPKLYADLLVTMARHGWGSENAEGWLVLCGPLAPIVDSADAGHDLAELIASAVAAAIPAAIRLYEADRKKQNRSKTKMSGTLAADVPDTVPSRAGAVERTIDIESKKDISFQSNERTREAPTLTMVPADVAQELLRHGIPSMRRAEILIKQHGLERCILVLACLPYWQPDNEGKAIESFLAEPSKWKIPKEIAQGTLPLLTGTQGGAPARPTQAQSSRGESIHTARERLTEAERQALRCEAIDRLSPVSRGEYDKATSLGHAAGALVNREIADAEDVVLRGRMRLAATG